MLQIAKDNPIPEHDTEIRLVTANNFQGLTQLWRISESKNPFVIGREILTQNVNGKFYIGFAPATPGEEMFSWKEFGDKWNLGVVFVGKPVWEK